MVEFKFMNNNIKFFGQSRSEGKTRNLQKDRDEEQRQDLESRPRSTMSLLVPEQDLARTRKPDHVDESIGPSHTSTRAGANELNGHVLVGCHHSMQPDDCPRPAVVNGSPPPKRTLNRAQQLEELSQT
ncbi:hypothetical protein TruAng_011101 [Truncatella angustata]|nr:hypothetical protein TruAng_011101 [Truncatella angustata]